MAEGAFVIGGEAAVFWTIRHTEVQISAGEAVRIVWAFLLAEGEEFRRRKKVGEIVLRNIAEFPFGQDVEIAWIDVAIVFDDQIVAAVAAHRADGWAACHEARDDGIEKTDRNRCDIIRIPCIEQLAEEVAPLTGL